MLDQFIVVLLAFCAGYLASKIIAQWRSEYKTRMDQQVREQRKPMTETIKMPNYPHTEAFANMDPAKRSTISDLFRKETEFQHQHGVLKNENNLRLSFKLITYAEYIKNNEEIDKVATERFETWLGEKLDQYGDYKYDFATELNKLRKS